MDCKRLINQQDFFQLLVNLSCYFKLLLRSLGSLQCLSIIQCSSVCVAECQVIFLLVFLDGIIIEGVSFLFFLNWQPSHELNSFVNWYLK
ncbi:hypothetical protein OIU78_004180 [Salix suchowensis]|nr:hypothetical protein OIU78_004180 [Salix suchowensis]